MLHRIHFLSQFSSPSGSVDRVPGCRVARVNRLRDTNLTSLKENLLDDGVVGTFVSGLPANNRHELCSEAFRTRAFFVRRIDCQGICSGRMVRRRQAKFTLGARPANRPPERSGARQVDEVSMDVCAISGNEDPSQGGPKWVSSSVVSSVAEPIRFDDSAEREVFMCCGGKALIFR